MTSWVSALWICLMRIRRADWATGWPLGDSVRHAEWIIELWDYWVERGLTGRQNGGPWCWSCSQLGQDLWAQGGHPSSGPVPTPTLAFQPLIFRMISLPPVLRLALGLRAIRVTAPFSTGKIFTETCFITVELRERTPSKIMHEFMFSYFVCCEQQQSDVESYVEAFESSCW